MAHMNMSALLWFKCSEFQTLINLQVHSTLYNGTVYSSKSTFSVKKAHPSKVESYLEVNM